MRGVISPPRYEFRTQPEIAVAKRSDCRTPVERSKAQVRVQVQVRVAAEDAVAISAPGTSPTKRTTEDPQAETCTQLTATGSSFSHSHHLSHHFPAAAAVDLAGYSRNGQRSAQLEPRRSTAQETARKPPAETRRLDRTREPSVSVTDPSLSTWSVLAGVNVDASRN